MFTALSGAEDRLPYDTHAVFRTHVPHLKSTGHGGAGADAKPSSGGGGAVFSGTPYAVDPTVTATTTGPEAEEHIAVNPVVGSFLVAAISDFSLRGGSNTTKYAVSATNGTSWSESFVPLTGGAPATGDGQVWPYNSDPVVAIDLPGNVYLADLYFHSETGDNSNGLYVSVGNVTLPDLGMTVAHTYAVSTQLDPATNVSEDKEWIAVDNSLSANTGNVYASWTRFIGNSDMILFSRSTNQGQTWSAPLRISPVTQDGAVQGSALAVGPNGEIYLAYEVFFVGGKRRQYLAKSTDGGQTFSAPVAVTPQFNELKFNSTYRKNSFASLAASPTDGSVSMVYADQPGQNARVEFIRSTNGGASFSAPVFINDSSSGQRLMPAVTIDPLGTIHASWFDTRQGGRSTALYDIYATRSLDGGATFSPNARVTGVTVNAGSASFIGDYSGVAAADGFAHPVWTSGGFNNGRLQTAALH
jgi:hypothetical protein